MENIIEENQKNYAEQKGYQFITSNLVVDPLPKVDLIFCRDLIIHIPNQRIPKLLENFIKTGSKWLLITHYTAGSDKFPLNSDITMGDYRPVDLTKEPFNLPPPLFIFPERETYKHMALWNLQDIHEFYANLT